MPKIDALKIWSLNYRMMMLLISSISPEIAALGIEVKELFVLAQIDESPNPAGLAAQLSMPKPTITVYLKHLEAEGFVQREIDPTDLRRHRLIVTPAGRQIMKRGLSLLSGAFQVRLARLSSAEQASLSLMLAKMT